MRGRHHDLDMDISTPSPLLHHGLFYFSIEAFSKSIELELCASKHIRVTVRLQSPAMSHSLRSAAAFGRQVLVPRRPVTRTTTTAAASSSSSSAAAAARQYHTTPRRALPYKDSQDRETLRPRTAEHTATGRDDDVAGAHPDAAFNPSKTRPETERRTAAAEEEKQNGGKGGKSAVEGSAANQELSKPRGDERSDADRGAGREVSKGGRSGAGSPPKKGEVGGLG